MHAKKSDDGVEVMATEMGAIYNAMTTDLGGKLNSFYSGLQSRYGDPRVYAMQREEMQKQDARLMHQESSRTAELLRSAYDARAEKNRSTHTTRMKKKLARPRPEASPQ